MARTELAIKVRINQLKKLIAMLRLGGAGTKTQVETALKEMKACEAELLTAAKR